jgi:hypothetical protein
MGQIGYRGIYSKKAAKPFRVSRSKIELFNECPRCFWLEAVRGIKRPRTPPFLINSAVDTLFKREFDVYRAKGEKHPLQTKFKVDAIPFAHEKLDEWRENFVGIQYHHEPTNLLIFGAVDDLWMNPEKEVMVVDYKATAKTKEITDLDSPGGWHDVYRRQMEIYQWLLRQIDLKVSDTGYFVYANGDDSKEGFGDKVEFRTNVFPYVGKDGWIEEKITELKECLDQEEIPEVGRRCTYCPYARERTELTLDYIRGKAKR